MLIPYRLIENAYISNFIFKRFIYLLKRATQSYTDHPSDALPPGLGKTKSRSFLLVSHSMAGAQIPGDPLVLFPGHYKEAGSEVERKGHELAPL